MKSENYKWLSWFLFICFAVSSCHYDKKIESLEHKVSILQSMTDDQSAQIADLTERVENVEGGNAG